MLSEYIANLLHSQELGVFDPEGIEGNIFINVLPSSPNNCICIYEKGGTAPSPGHVIEYPGIQVIVRNTRMIQASLLSQSIFNVLHSHVSYADNILLIKAENYPYYIGQDSNKRFEYSTNYSIIKER